MSSTAYETGATGYENREEDFDDGQAASSQPSSRVASQNARQEPDQRRQRVQAAETCLAVLKALAGLGGRASLTAIGAAVDESPAKVHRYLASLMAEGLVEQDRGGTQYALGREAIHIGLAAMRQNDPVRMSEPALQHLRESLQVTSFVAVMGNMGPTIVRFEEPSLPITVNVRVGSVMSMLWSATGRAFCLHGAAARGRGAAGA
jgi:DNA-binding IclR family transcriptional regulator